MKIDPFIQEGYQLLHEGAIELALVEANGIRVDVPLLEATKSRLSRRIKRLRDGMQSSKLWKRWRREFGGKSNMTSRDQLAQMLYEVLGHEVQSRTQGGKPSTDEEALQKIDHPFVRKILRVSKYEKALGTFLQGIEKEIVEGRLHPAFNLHIARSYRSSSDSPNFQNFPVRDKEISKLIRSLFIASPKSVLVENDFKGIEVSVSACYHKDPNFISYITTPGKDMHRDMAAQLYHLKPEEVSKDARYGAKNKFVFPQFYGDFYVSCARSLWEWIEKGKLTGPDGIPLARHLKACGIRELGACDPESKPVRGTFEYHVREVENDFWNNRFRQYGKWRRDWFDRYQRKGYFDMLTGFRVHGYYNRNSVTNYPIQGSAFHCLLWSLIRINRRLRKYRMKSRIVGQIHDSLLGDVRETELGDYLEIVEKVTTVELRRHYQWLIVPLEIEYEIAPRGGSWFDKQEFQFRKGRFGLPGRPGKHTRYPARFLAALDNKEAS